MNSDHRPRQWKPRKPTSNRSNGNAKIVEDSNNDNASATSSTAPNRRNGNGRPNLDRDAPSTSRAVDHSVFSVSVVQPEGEEEDWGQPDPGYWKKKERINDRKQRETNFWKKNTSKNRVESGSVAQGAFHEPMVFGRNTWGKSRIMAQGAIPYLGEVEPQADWGYDSTYVDHGASVDYGRMRDQFNGFSNLLEPQSCSETVPDHHAFNALSLTNSHDVQHEDGDSSKDSGVAWTDDSYHRGHPTTVQRTGATPRWNEYDERSSIAILKVYSNDLLMETIISNITRLNDRSQIEMASSRMHTLSKNAPYLFSKGGDHLHIHFTTFDDFATIQYGSVVRTVPILTLDTRRFDKMEPKMTIALRRILDNIKSRFGRKVRKITLGGTTEFYSARGVPDHHLILTHDFIFYLLTTFECVTSLHLINCGLDDGAIDICDTPLWKTAMARMECIELRTVWADTPNRLPIILSSPACNLEYFTLTRFTCKRMGAALLELLRISKCRLKEVQLVIDEDTAEDQFEMFCLLKEVASRTDSLRITLAEIGDGVAPSPKCFSILSRLRDVPNLTELKVYVQPKNAGQFEAMITMYRDFEFLTSLRTLHMEGFVDQHWLTVDMIYNLAEAFKTGMTYLGQTLVDVSFSNFPRPTKYNIHGYKGDRKEGAYSSLWESMGVSIGTRKTKRLALTSVRMEDAHLRRIYNRINRFAEEVYLRNIRGVTAKSVAPLLNGEFPMLHRLEAEIAVEPLLLHNLGDLSKAPHLQYAKLALKRRISEADHHTKILRAMFGSVFFDQESPRGPLLQFVEVHHRIPGAKPPTPALEPHSGSSRPRPSNRPPRPFDYRTAGYGSQPRRQPTKLLYGEWD